MTIKASAASRIDALVGDLTGPSAVKREGAVARLTILGARAVGRLVVLAGSSEPAPARAAAFRALEVIADPRALDPALAAVTDADASVAAAAIGGARAFLRGPQGAAAVDRLSAIALDRAQPESLRVAALRALAELERATIAPLLKTLANDPSAAVRREAASQRKRRRATATDPADTVMLAADHDLPDDPAALHDAIVHAGEAVPLLVLLRIVERVRDREASENGVRRVEWTTTRAAAHVALAQRGSRLALYDLRESVQAATSALPVEFVTAISLIGDRSCLEPIAAAHARTKDQSWRQQLGDAFRTIAARERLTRRHAALKKIEKRFRDIVDRHFDAPPVTSDPRRA
jgi:HEAT repeat protein